MLRFLMSRHGAHQVKISGLSGIERAGHVHEMRAEQPVEQRALLGTLPDDLRLALPRVHVDVRARDVQVPAQDHLPPRGMQGVSPLRELRHEGELGRIVLAAVGNVHGRQHQIA